MPASPRATKTRASGTNAAKAAARWGGETARSSKSHSAKEKRSKSGTTQRIPLATALDVRSSQGGRSSGLRTSFPAASAFWIDSSAVSTSEVDSLMKPQPLPAKKRKSPSRRLTGADRQVEAASVIRRTRADWSRIRSMPRRKFSSKLTERELSVRESRRPAVRRSRSAGRRRISRSPEGETQEPGKEKVIQRLV